MSKIKVIGKAAESAEYRPAIGKIVDEGFYELVIPKEMTVGEMVYVVSVVYDTGDSENEYNGLIQWMAAYSTPQPALNLMKKLGDIAEMGSDAPHSIEIKLDDGSEMKTSLSFVGYFESVQEVRVDALTLCI